MMYTVVALYEDYDMNGNDRTFIQSFEADNPSLAADHALKVMDDEFAVVVAVFEGDLEDVYS